MFDPYADNMTDDEVADAIRAVPRHFSYDFPVYGTHEIPLTTAASGTYGYLIPPWIGAAGNSVLPGSSQGLGAWTGLLYVQYTTGGTAEAFYVLRPLGFTHLAAAAAGGQAVITLNADPGNYSQAATAAGVAWTFSTPNNLLASGKYIAYQCPDGTYRFDTVSSVASIPTVTLTTNLPTGGLAAGAPFWYFGAVGDTNPYDAQPHPKFNMFASQASAAGIIGTYSGDIPIVQSYGTNNPLLILATSTSAQSWIESGKVVYLQRPGPYGPSGSRIPLPNG